MSITLLEEYITAGDLNGVSDLVASQPELLKQKTSFNISPLMLSSYYRKQEIIDHLLSSVSDLTMFEAAATGKFDTLAHLVYKYPETLNDFSADGFTALGLASYFGKEEITRYLLLKGAEVNLASNNGYRVYPLHSAVAANYNMVAKMLLEGGAEVNVQQQSGVTPLHSAAQNGNIELLISLLEAGADVSMKMDGDKTAADLALEKGFVEIAKILKV